MVSCCDIDDELFGLIENKNIIFHKVKSPLPFFEQFVIPFLVRKYKPDACWFPSNTFPLYKPNNVKYIATIHDLIFLYDDIKPKNITQIIGKYYRAFVIKNGIKKLDQITSVSFTALEEIVNTFELPKGYLTLEHVLYNSVDIGEILDDRILNKLNVEQNKYFYTISGSAPSKNLAFLIKAFAIYLNETNENTKLVVSGISKKKEKEEFILLAGTLGIESSLVFTDFISESEKYSLLKNCQLFIFASKYEGFGIPLIEALYHGCIVLASDIPVFREIGGEYVNYFDNTKINFLVEFYKNRDMKNINNYDFFNIQKYVEEKFNLYITVEKLKIIFRKSLS